MDILEFGGVEVERYTEVLAIAVRAVARASRDAAIVELQPIAGEIWMGRLTAASKSGGRRRLVVGLATRRGGLRYCPGWVPLCLFLGTRR